LLEKCKDNQINTLNDVKNLSAEKIESLLEEEEERNKF
jgi:hypothetical protein